MHAQHLLDFGQKNNEDSNNKDYNYIQLIPWKIYKAVLHYSASCKV